MLAFVPIRAESLWGDQPQSVCILPPPSHGQSYHLSARLVVHGQGGVLSDPTCPGRTLLIRDFSQVYAFLKDTDPEGRRFGTAGTGTYVDIELVGQVDEERVVAVSEVRAYARYDVIDRRWRINSTEDWIHTSGWQADEQFPFTRSPRTLKSASHMAVVHGGVSDDTVDALMKLAKVDAGSFCQFSESAQSMVRMQCSWQGPLISRKRAWVYARDADTWRLVQKSDAAIR